MNPPTAAGHVRSLHRHPVKSMQGEALESLHFGAGGPLGDRALAVVDAETTKVASAKLPKRWSALLGCLARFRVPPDADGLPGAVEVMLPDGEWLAAEAADAALSELLGRKVRLTRERPQRIRVDRLDPLADDEVLVDIGDLMPPDRFVDAAAVHVVTGASLRAAAALGDGEDGGAAARYRPNLVLEMSEGARGFVENEWTGSRLLIGADVVLRVDSPSPRCALPTLAQVQPGLQPATALLRSLAAHNRVHVPMLDAKLPCLGCYASVERTGVVRAGDPVVLG